MHPQSMQEGPGGALNGRRLPVADDVARAIVAACRETGEDPIRAASGNICDVNGPTIRARHYAMHALLEVFPELEPESAARFVGSPGKHPLQFYNSSKTAILGHKGKGAGRAPARWWSSELLWRVIRAIGTGFESTTPDSDKKLIPAIAGTLPAMQAEPSNSFSQTVPKRVASPSPSKGVTVVSARKGSFIAAVLEEFGDELLGDRPVMDAGAFADRKPRTYGPALSSKAALQEELRQAARNTAALPRPPDGDE